MAQNLVILSPEKAVIQFRMATVGSRVLAFLIDLLIFTMLAVCLTILCGIIVGFGSLPEGFATMAILVLFSLGPFAYFILFEGLWNGQTLGKKSVGIRVRMSDGTPITFAAALGRNLLLPADLFPGTGFVGLMAMFMNDRCQRIGDLVSNTVVLHERRPEPIFSPAPHSVGLHPLEGQVGDLARMTSDEYMAIRRLCDRYPELPRNVQQKLMREVWSPFSARHDLPNFPNVDPIYVAEAVVMRYGRIHGLL